MGADYLTLEEKRRRESTVLCPHSSDTSKWMPGQECSYCIREMLLAQATCWAVGHADGGKLVARIDSPDAGGTLMLRRCSRCKQLFST